MREMALVPFSILPSSCSNVLPRTVVSCVPSAWRRVEGNAAVDDVTRVSRNGTCAKLGHTLVRHDKDQSGRALHSLDDVGHSDDVVPEIDIRKVLLVDVSFVDDLRQLLALELYISLRFFPKSCVSDQKSQVDTREK